MRDYDAQRKSREEDLGFVMGGRAFTVRVLPWTIVGTWSDRETQVNIEDTAAFQQMLVDRIADAVDDGNGSREAWTEVCAGEQAPSYGELLELGRWVWDVQAELPTQQPAPSEPGRGTTAASSKGA